MNSIQDLYPTKEERAKIIKVTTNSGEVYYKVKNSKCFYTSVIKYETLEEAKKALEKAKESLIKSEEIVYED